MADVTITLGQFTQTKTLTAAQVTRLLNAYKAHMNNPDATNQDVADFVMDNFFGQLKAVTKEHENRAAQEAVLDSDFDYG